MAKPRLKEKYLSDKFPKKPSKIFVGSSTDMWGEWVPWKWIEKVLKKVEENPQHTFQFLTKNPLRYSYYKSLPKNAWYGTSMDGTANTLGNIENLLISVPDEYVRFVSFEPLIESPIISSEFALLDWIIIGADSTRGAKKPPESWADFLNENACENAIPVFVKDNYGYPETIKEFPV